MMNKRKSWVDAGKPNGSNHDVYSLYKAAKRHIRRMHQQASQSFMKSQFDEIDRLAEVYHCSGMLKVEENVHVTHLGGI